MFIYTWIIITPIIIFQALLSARDDGDKNITASGATTPIFLLFSALMLFSFYFAKNYRTRFQVMKTLIIMIIF